ncbi:hypothetical protein BDR22DRAFT_914136 [Usnea florida]
MEGLFDFGNIRPREMNQMPADEHPSRPRSNSVMNAEIEQMIAELRTREEEHDARVEEIRHSTQFFEDDADLFRRAGIMGSREAVRLQSMSNAASRAEDSAELTPAGIRFMEQLPVVDGDDFPDEPSCGICMESYGSTDEPESRARLPCGHFMGRRCIERWLATCNTCPMCRHVLVEEDAESPAFLELQEILQRLGPAFMTLFYRMLDHITHSSISRAAGGSRAGRTEEAVLDAMNVLAQARRMREAVPRSNTAFGIETSQTVTAADDNSEEVHPSMEDDGYPTWGEIDELRRQQTVLEERLADYNSRVANGLQGEERGAVLGQLIADNQEVNHRLLIFHRRRREVREMLGMSRSGAE